MNVLHPNITYSSIVKIGEDALNLEKTLGTPFLKLHRGVMDVTTVEINHLLDFTLDSKLVQQYCANDGYQPLINSINKLYQLKDNKVVVVPGGMATLDLVINSLADETFHIPTFHWGSWNKILKVHKKHIETFDEFNLNNVRPTSGVIMLCFPSNPTGYQPSTEEINGVLKHAKENNITVILDLPYYNLFHPFDDSIENMITDNVILISSFSKSIGLSGMRIGFISTKSMELYETLRIRSLYKYNSISVLPQLIIERLINEHLEKGSESSISKYKALTAEHITKNIQHLKDMGILSDIYPVMPIGPFAIVKLTFDELIAKKISSVPLSKFTISDIHKDLSRISVAVKHEDFVKYFN